MLKDLDILEPKNLCEKIDRGRGSSSCVEVEVDFEGRVRGFVRQVESSPLNLKKNPNGSNKSRFIES